MRAERTQAVAAYYYLEIGISHSGHTEDAFTIAIRGDYSPAMWANTYDLATCPLSQTQAGRCSTVVSGLRGSAGTSLCISILFSNMNQNISTFVHAVLRPECRSGRFVVSVVLRRVPEVVVVLVGRRRLAPIHVIP